MDIPIIGKRIQEQRTVEVCRSFAYKLNLANHGGPQYESADFFASRKLECSSEEVEAVSEELYEECLTEVRNAIASFLVEMKRKKVESARRPHPVSTTNSAAYERWRAEDQLKESGA
jgi:hypothetical protein